MQPTIVYILSTNYAGSHFTSLMVGSHSQAMHVGEISRLRKTDSPKLAWACHLCGEKENCRLLRGITPGRIDQIYELIYRNIEDSYVTTLVDNSKKPAWAARFLGREDLTRKYIHLIRDPRALVRRWLQTYSAPRRRWQQRWRVMRAFPLWSWKLLVIPYPMVLAYKWLAQNREISRFLTQHDLQATTVTYRDLAFNPEAELERLDGFVGLPYEPGQEAYWEFEHHGTQKKEYEWVKSDRVRHFDRRWQNELPARLQKAVRYHPALQDYVRRSGLAWTPDGLSRHAASGQGERPEPG